jgi:PBP1b-binding outer membrane lipoprotein LpoB
MKKSVLITAAALLALSCTSGPKRVDPSTQIDLSGYWNDTDVRIVCKSFIDDIMANPRFNESVKDFKSRPKVLVGPFANDSDEHIDTGIITTVMEDEIFNSGRLDFVAGGALRDIIRAERLDQRDWASEETAVRLGRETGADFLLTGSVKTIVDRWDNESTRTYFVSSGLTNIENGERVWMKTNSEIKKYMKRPKNKI